MAVLSPTMVMVITKVEGFDDEVGDPNDADGVDDVGGDGLRL